MLTVAKLFAALSILVLAPVLTNADEKLESLTPLRTHSIYAPYVDQDLQNRWFDFGGDAYINTNKYIRLTQDRASETGWLWSRLPITVSNFQVDVEFKITGQSYHLFGDGLAIWLTKSRAEFGPVFGSKDNFEGLGVFVDTYANSRHTYSFPRIVGMLGDGRTSYNLGDDGETNAAGACSASIRRNDIKTMVRIVYKKNEGVKVLLQYKGWDEWTPCFEIKNATLPSMTYLGISAITGEVHDAHDVISIATSSILERPNLDFGKKVMKGGKLVSEFESGGSSWFWFLFKLLLLVGVCAGAYQGYMVYRVRGGKWSNDTLLGSNKRF